MSRTSPSMPPAHVHVGAFHHRRAVFRDARAMKRRLRQPPLPPPEISLADEQALPQQPLRHILRQRALVKLRLLDDGHLLDVVRMIQQNTVMPKHRNAHNVAIFPRHAHQRSKRVAQNVQRQAQQRRSCWPRRKPRPVCGGCRGRCSSHCHEFVRSLQAEKWPVLSSLIITLPGSNSLHQMWQYRP